ncbi:methyltransferase domain-containing protein [Helicobacter saguini]|uniref:Class I SAM-dependent methyltransferase n=1 Tax=Helicobacter saguini TaxID=1548018 RepID=A0A347W0M2_9HELI|nr:methyltransferase domain-containing protein [Helicobacter saguini]MWV67524.1 methyltransferase domain-containing protein [Helicobacter saguini]MWV69876.1 methyltransferase domain-containing protein [Helicobacter saguini]MWV72907.1 methyltransferase domain-containing protein [Helicobacter saguini]TLD93282.1 class I SAM-dependent methyltransferase [Helicobacter saguini]
MIYKGDMYKSGVGIVDSIESNIAINHGGGANMSSLAPLSALDFGCGIGRQSLLLSEFHIESYGIDISSEAINEAKNLANLFVKNLDSIKMPHFSVYDGEKIPFDDNFFDFSMSYGVLDSMPFSLAKSLFNEMCRVSKKYIFLSLIGEDSTSLFSNLSGDFSGEIVVKDSHEFGTIQSFFNENKIHNLIKDSIFYLKWGQRMQHIDLMTNKTYSRYFIVLERR